MAPKSILIDHKKKLLKYSISIAEISNGLEKLPIKVTTKNRQLIDSN